MDDVRAGRILRVLRLRLRLTQAQLASKVGIAQSTVSLVERGHLDRLALGTVRTMFAVVEARYDGVVSWRGGAVDRLLDEHHARLVGATTGRLRRLGWEVDVEVTFNDYGDRGSIDILAVRATDGVALVVEIKTELTSVEETLRRLGVKERLAARIVFGRSGRRPVTVGRLVVLLEASKNRRRVQRYAAVLDVALPDRGPRVRTWLGTPNGPLSGLLFSSSSDGRGPGQTERPQRRPEGPNSCRPAGRLLGGEIPDPTASRAPRPFVFGSTTRRRTDSGDQDVLGAPCALTAPRKALPCHAA